MDKVSIIILNYKRSKDTIECLKGVFLMDHPNINMKVYLVDNASNDNSLEEIKESNTYQKNKQKIEIIENKQNYGFAKGNNIGLKRSIVDGFEYAMVLNNDTLLDKKLLVCLHKELKKDDNIACVSPKIYFAKGFEFKKGDYNKKDLGKVLWYAGGIIDWDNVFGLNRGVDQVDTGQFDKRQDIDFATGTCCLFRTSVLKSVGLYDERYFMYYEDVDLSVRFVKNGLRVLYTPKAIIYHKVAQSSGIGSNLNDYFISRNRMLFGFKYAPLRTIIALIKESLKILFKGRRWQRRGISDFYILRFGKGSYK